ncbi:MAG: hypothetical protein AAGI30_11160 [Planctomycetota bacterium]
MAHVNFRNLDTDDPNDLGMAGVDIYTFGPDWKLAEQRLTPDTTRLGGTER